MIYRSNFTIRIAFWCFQIYDFEFNYKILVDYSWIYLTVKLLTIPRSLRVWTSCGTYDEPKKSKYDYNIQTPHITDVNCIVSIKWSKYMYIFYDFISISLIWLVEKPLNKNKGFGLSNDETTPSLLFEQRKPGNTTWQRIY